MAGFNWIKIRDKLHFHEIPIPKVAVETGTFHGDTTEKLCKVFKEVYTVELDKDLYFTAGKKLLKECPNLTMIQGDSSKVVKNLCAVSEPIFWYLDAHWFKCPTTKVAEGNPMPLWDELKAITKRKYWDVVVVDDTHAFGRTKDINWGDINPTTITKACEPRVSTYFFYMDKMFMYLEGENVN